MAARDLTALDPSHERAAALDHRMRERLGASLRYLLSEAAGVLELAPSILDNFFNHLSSAPISPLVFNAYFETVLALENRDFVAARQLLLEIAEASSCSDSLRVVEFSDAGPTARYRRLVRSDPHTPFEVLPPAPALAQAGRRVIDEAFTLMDRGDPALAAEIRALLRQIVLAVEIEAPQATTFEGASSFMFWGAIMLNARIPRTALDMVQALAHESGHTLLFGLCADGPLVEDDDAPRYRSPLRRDRRPMDGIVHATFVTARMHRAVARLLGARALSPDAVKPAHLALARHAQNFADGLYIVDRHGQLTALGRAVIEDARRYMQTTALESAQ